MVYEHSKMRVSKGPALDRMIEIVVGHAGLYFGFKGLSGIPIWVQTWVQYGSNKDFYRLFSAKKCVVLYS